LAPKSVTVRAGCGSSRLESPRAQPKPPRVVLGPFQRGLRCWPPCALQRMWLLALGDVCTSPTRTTKSFVWLHQRASSPPSLAGSSSLATTGQVRRRVDPIRCASQPWCIPCARGHPVCTRTCHHVHAWDALWRGPARVGRFVAWSSPQVSTG
jgi:hypothetical protein